MADPPLDVLRVPVFEGRNTFVSPHDIKPTESPDDLNVDGETPGQLRKRRGIARFSTTQLGTDAITGLFRYYKVDGSKYLMALCGTQLWAGAGTPPDLHVIKTGLTGGSWMTLLTNQDWCFGTNYYDQPLRFDGVSVTRMGVAAPIGGAVGYASSATTYGRMTANSTYAYRFQFVYGKLGPSNLNVDFVETFTAATNTMFLSGLEFYRPGAGTTPTPAEAGNPTKIRIYRSLAYSGTFAGDPDGNIFILGKPFYFIDEIDYPLSGPIFYTDRKGDDQLTEEYQGHSFSEPYFDLWMTYSYPQNFNALKDGYQWTPRGRYICEHKNRIWLGNIQQAKWTTTTTPSQSTFVMEQFPNRAYWSRSFQPDALDDFVDVEAEDGDFITGLASNGEYLIVFKTQRIYAIFGSGPSSFEVKIIDNSTGCMAPRSIVQMEHAIYFLGKDGVYAYNGGPVERISESIRPDILAINRVDREFACAGQWNGRYYIAWKEPV